MFNSRCQTTHEAIAQLTQLSDLQLPSKPSLRNSTDTKVADYTTGIQRLMIPQYRTTHATFCRHKVLHPHVLETHIRANRESDTNQIEPKITHYQCIINLFGCIPCSVISTRHKYQPSILIFFPNLNISFWDWRPRLVGLIGHDTKPTDSRITFRMLTTLFNLRNKSMRRRQNSVGRKWAVLMARDFRRAWDRDAFCIKVHEILRLGTLTLRKAWYPETKDICDLI
jgi:hypothetical protein